MLSNTVMLWCLLGYFYCVLFWCCIVISCDYTASAGPGSQSRPVRARVCVICHEVSRRHKQEVGEADVAYLSQLSVRRRLLSKAVACELFRSSPSSSRPLSVTRWRRRRRRRLWLSGLWSAAAALGMLCVISIAPSLSESSGSDCPFDCRRSSFWLSINSSLLFPTRDWKPNTSSCHSATGTGKSTWLLSTWFDMVPVNTMVTLTLLFWALRNFRSFTLHNNQRWVTKRLDKQLILILMLTGLANSNSNQLSNFRSSLKF